MARHNPGIRGHLRELSTIPDEVVDRSELLLTSVQARKAVLVCQAAAMVEIKVKATRILRNAQHFESVRKWAEGATGSERKGYRDVLIKVRMPTCLVARLTGYKVRGLRKRARLLGAEPIPWSWGRSARRSPPISHLRGK